MKVMKGVVIRMKIAGPGVGLKFEMLKAVSVRAIAVIAAMMMRDLYFFKMMYAAVVGMMMMKAMFE